MTESTIMNDLYSQIDIVLNECSKSLNIIENEEECNDSFYKNLFKVSLIYSVYFLI